MVKDKSLKLDHKGVTICVLFATQLETNTLFDLGYIILDFERFLCPLYALFMGGSRSIFQVPPHVCCLVWFTLCSWGNFYSLIVLPFLVITVLYKLSLWRSNQNRNKLC